MKKRLAIFSLGDIGAKKKINLLAQTYYASEKMYEEMNLFFGKVTDQKIRIEKISGENNFGYFGFITHDCAKLVPKIDILNLIAKRHMKNLLITQEA